MKQLAHTTYAIAGDVAARARGAATFAGSGAMWHAVPATPANTVVIDGKLHRRRPEEGASH